jgi:hypothetical protein
MRGQIYIIAALLSLIMWVMSFDVAVDAYHDAQEVGAIPNLHIRSHLHHIIHEIRPH